MEANPDPGVDPGQLKKALEWELSLDTRDLRSHPWYHGAIPRVRAEDIVQEKDGDFLVRDCTSQPGNYVLTCRTKSQGLHFVINKVVIQPDTVYERVQYQFEDDAYDTVPDLITYYVGSGKPISAASGARIITPKNRLYPLSFYATKYGVNQQISPLASPHATASGTLRCNTYNSYHSPVHSPPRTKREIPPRLPSKKQRSLSLTPSEINGRSLTLVPRCTLEDRGDITDGVGSDPAATMTRSTVQENKSHCKFTTHSLPRGAGMTSSKLSVNTNSGVSTMPRNTKIVRVTSDPALSPCLERRNFVSDVREEGDDVGFPELPPPKPSRLPSLIRSSSKESSVQDSDLEDLRLSDCPHMHGTFQRVVSYHASGSDSGNGSGDSVQSSATGDGSESTTPVAHHRPGGVVIKNPRYTCQGIPSSCSSTTLKAFEYDAALDDSILLLSAPNVEMISFFDLENFQTLLLPTLENKPLDATALKGVRMMLQETGSRVLANHLTRVDLEIAVGSDSSRAWDGGLGLGISSGIELCSLPLGHQLRIDLMERTQCLKLLVAVTILTCTNEAERAEMLNKWIQVAIDTKTALGNLFGFSSIMIGLSMPQVQRLGVTWHVLRQKFTDSAFNFEAKLRPILKSMNDCTNPQAPNTTIPHLIPFILLQERTLDNILGASAIAESSLEASCLSNLESSTPDFGLSTVLAHLEAARRFTAAVQTFRRNAEIVLDDSKVDDLLLDTFRTEFHLKFLWGSRGAIVHAIDRHSKFEQVLSVMSEKCEQSLTEISSPQPAPPFNPAIGTSV